MSIGQAIVLVASVFAVSALLIGVVVLPFPLNNVWVFMNAWVCALTAWTLHKARRTRGRKIRVL